MGKQAQCRCIRHRAADRPPKAVLPRWRPQCRPAPVRASQITYKYIIYIYIYIYIQIKIFLKTVPKLCQNLNLRYPFFWGVLDRSPFGFGAGGPNQTTCVCGMVPGVPTKPRLESSTRYTSQWLASKHLDSRCGLLAAPWVPGGPTKTRLESSIKKSNSCLFVGRSTGPSLGHWPPHL